MPETVLADCLHCFGGPNGGYLGLKEFKTKASISSIFQQNIY